MNTPAAPIEFRHGADAQPDDLILTCSRTLLSGIASSVLVLRASGHVAFANQAAEAMIGRKNADLTGIELSTLFREDSALSQASDAGKTTRRGKLRIHGNGQLPVRIDVRHVQSETGNLQGSVVTIEDLSDLLQMNECVQQILQCDTLTGLPKGESLTDAIEASLMQLHTTGRAFALLELNIDQFRRIKESLGHDAASSAIREVANRLVKSVRKDDVVTRSTSDAFTILIKNCESQEDALARAESVLGAFKEPFHFGPYCTHVTASIGMSFSRPGSVAVNAFSTEAELALRRSKALGGNRIVCFEPSMADWRSHAVQMESQMQSALANDEFYVVYQPQICCQTGRLVGVEALLRWQSPTNGMIMPNTFIPAAEECGLIVQLGEWCMRTACQEMVSLQRDLGYPVRLAVNVSPKQIHSAGFKEFVRKTLQETGMPPELLELEITEGLLMSHEEAALSAIRSMQELGISIAMDDFGMGFSNLSYITRFKIDRLKIDRSFVMRCPGDHNSRMITTSLVFLAKSLGIEVVAEGVETQEQAALLAELRCDVAQGFLYSRPTTAADILAMAANTSQRRSHARAQQASRPTDCVDPVVAAARVSIDGSASDLLSSQRIAEDPASDRVVPVAEQPGSVLDEACPAQAQPVTASSESPSSQMSSAIQAQESLPATQAVDASSPLAEANFNADASVPEPPAEVFASAAGTQPMADLQDAVTRGDTAFTAHTILVPLAPGAERLSCEASSRAGDRRNARRAQNTSHLPASPEPREPICRPTRPQRLPGAMRIRWTSVPESETV